MNHSAHHHAHGAHAGSDEEMNGLPLPELAIWGNLVIYVAAWVLLMWPQHLPLGRPGIAMVFAALACQLRTLCCGLWPEAGYPEFNLLTKINPTPIGLLFGLMLVNSYLKDTGWWALVEAWLDSSSPRLFLIKISAGSAILSAVLLNDTICFVLPPIVLDICAKRGARNTLPYLIAVSSSANLGSSLTIIGNPQNALIASICPDIKFISFMLAMLAPVAAGLAVNTAALCVWYRADLVFEPSLETICENPGVLPNPYILVDPEKPGRNSCVAQWGKRSYVVVCGIVVVGMVTFWLLGFSIENVAIAAGTTLMLMRAVYRKCATETDSSKTETEFSLEAVDFSLLVLFAGQFVLVGATVDTGLPQRLFRHLLGHCAGDLVSGPLCTMWFVGVVMMLSNLISNVPVILMLAPLLAAQPPDTHVEVWVLCAWAATAAGNLTILGSAANLIVAHAAEIRGDHCYNATSHGTFSFVPTLVVTMLGTFVMPPLGGMREFYWIWALPIILVAAGVAWVLLHPSPQSMAAPRHSKLDNFVRPDATRSLGL